MIDLQRLEIEDRERRMNIQDRFGHLDAIEDRWYAQANPWEVWLDCIDIQTRVSYYPRHLIYFLWKQMGFSDEAATEAASLTDQPHTIT